MSRAGFAATRCHVEVADSSTGRTWSDVRTLLEGVDLDPAVADSARRTFERLAGCEAAVHGTTPEEVHFHEVGALDAIADVVGVCAGLHHLGLDALVVSPVALGGGHVDTAHGRLPVPAPAVTALLVGAPSYGGPVEVELCTPTGAALLATHATGWGPQPLIRTDAIGVGAGGRDPAGHANVLRLVVGEAHDETRGTDAVVLETNVDDLDPRLWPPTIAALLEAGASDAWLTPILMKKGRPAHTLSVLVWPSRLDVVRREVFRHTTSIGLRERPVTKTALEREMRAVEVGGHRIEVKVASLDGEVLNVQPEFEHALVAATALGRPVKDVLQEAAALARRS